VLIGALECQEHKFAAGQHGMTRIVQLAGAMASIKYTSHFMSTLKIVEL